MVKTDDSLTVVTSEAPDGDNQQTAPAPKKRNKEASKQKLLQAAVEVFARQGYDAATTKQVAKAAGVNEALIQKYFDGKAGLLLAVLNTLGDNEDKNPCAACPANTDLEKDINAYFEQTISHCEGICDMMGVAVSRAIVDERIANFLKEKMTHKKLGPLMKRLEVFQTEGKIAKDVNLEASAYGMISVAFYLGFMSP